MKDGFALFYIKNDMICPVALTEEQQQAFELFMCAMPGTITIINKPQGQAVNLLEQRNGGKD